MRLYSIVERLTDTRFKLRQQRDNSEVTAPINQLVRHRVVPPPMLPRPSLPQDIHLDGRLVVRRYREDNNHFTIDDTFVSFANYSRQDGDDRWLSLHHYGDTLPNRRDDFSTAVRNRRLAPEWYGESSAGRNLMCTWQPTLEQEPNCK